MVTGISILLKQEENNKRLPFQKSEDRVLLDVYKKLIQPYENDLPNDYTEALSRICSRKKYGALISSQSFRGLEMYATCNVMPIPKAAFSHGAASMITSKRSPYKRMFNHQ
jgi:hypothetical protein